MKKLTKMCVAAVAGIAVLGCTSCSTAMGGAGMLVSAVTVGQTATSNPVGTKVGTSEAYGVLGLVNAGNASIQKAARDGGITKISHVDVKTLGVLGIFTQYKTIVYGE